MHDQIKRFITCYVPVTACNFTCSYCYLRGIKERGIKKFVLPPREMARKLSVERLGGICYFNLCADGETMLHPDLIEFIGEITEIGHYADIITNGTVSNKFDQLIDRLSPDQQGRLLIKFSFHYEQLKEKGLLEIFAENVIKIKNSNISFSIEITPHDELIDRIEEIKKYCLEMFGALPHITVARDMDTQEIALLTKYDRDRYSQVWSQFDSAMFDFKMKTFNEKRKEFCYAGDWSIKLNLETGVYQQCYVGAILGNICDEKSMKFKAIGKCRLPHCYNGHAFLALGNIPELECPTYAEERDRRCIDGKNWLKKTCSDFFSTKLYETNNQYSKHERMKSILSSTKDIIEDKIARKIRIEF